MNLRLPVIPILALALVSCDKAKDLARKASSAMKDQIAARSGNGAPTKVDPALEKLVDQTPEGAVFRKDLPFPARLEVRTTRRHEISGRFYQTSAIERHSEVVNGTRLQISRLESTSNQVRYTLEQSGFSIPTPDKPEAEKKNVANPLEQAAPSTKPVTFRKTGGAWIADASAGFRAAVLSKQISPVFDQLLVENAVAPRPLWFAKRRLKPGDQIVVNGDSLPMMVAGGAKGSITLKLESFEPVEGHPCGVFTIKGDFSRKEFPDFEGNLTDEEVAIQSGKIWLSLIYPIVLREELDTIQTFKSGGQGGLVGRGQGAIKVSVKRDWKPLGS